MSKLWFTCEKVVSHDRRIKVTLVIYFFKISHFFYFPIFQAQRRWIEEQEEFRRKQREHEIQMIEMEGAEVKRRELEVKKLGTELEETRRKNRSIQEKVAEQIEILQRKLQEYKVEHKQHEESIEDDITTKEEAIFQVKESLEKRRKTLELDCDDELDDVPDTCLLDKTG